MSAAEAKLMSCVSDQLIDEVVRLARSSPRRRVVHRFHRPTERLQRMLNAGMRGTYVAPHVHDRPRKLEIFVILRGTVSVVIFDGVGNVIRFVNLSDRGPVRSVEIPAGTWHSFVVVTPSAVVYELIDGRYSPSTHKRFARWAPGESDHRQAAVFLRKLKRKISAAGPQCVRQAR